jgi:hypothetical protein
MQLLNSLLAFATLLLPLVSAEACVAGGPSQQVAIAKQCCFNNAGTWYQFYDVQAIVRLLPFPPSRLLPSNISTTKFRTLS